MAQHTRDCACRQGIKQRELYHILKKWSFSGTFPFNPGINQTKFKLMINIILWNIHTTTLEERNHNKIMSKNEVLSRITSSTSYILFTYYQQNT